MLEEICPELNLQYSEIDDEKADKNSNMYVTLKSKEFFSQGCYDVLKLQCLGFLLCKHHDKQSRMDEFWQLVNPEIEEECNSERVKEILKTFILIAIVLRLRVERSKNQEEKNHEAIEYLEKIGEEVDTFEEIEDSIIFKLIGKDLETESPMNYSELFNLINPDRCLNTLGIRKAILS